MPSKFPSKIRPTKIDFLRWIIFMTLSKPYSSESKFRCCRFGTFWRFLAFVLAKLPLKAELENGVTFLFLLTLELQKVGLCWSAIYHVKTFKYQNDRIIDAVILVHHSFSWNMPHFWEKWQEVRRTLKLEGKCKSRLNSNCNQNVRLITLQSIQGVH